jgi:hypothetical protein
MKQYIGTKTVEAEPMGFLSFNQRQGRTMAPDATDREGYLVRYPDGYESWSPKDVFEEAYDELLAGPNTDGKNLLKVKVFPSEILSIAVAPDPDYGGAHQYQFQNSLGFNSQIGEAEYDHSYQKIKFVQKNLDGTMSPGIQSEQLLLALIDRHEKLNAKFSSEDGAYAIEHMRNALHFLEKRVRERMKRGVMGDLKK